MNLPRVVLEAAQRIREGVDATQSPRWLPYLRENGEALWPHTYGKPGVETDLQALAALNKYCQSLPEGTRKSHLVDLCTVPSCAQELLSDVLWVHSACPVVMTTHRFASAAICTSLPSNLDLRSPWRCWLLEIPDKLLWVEDPERHVRTWLRYCLVRTMETEIGTRWSITGMGEATIVQVGCRNITQEDLLSADPSGDPGQGTALDWPIDKEVDRVIACLKALVSNLLVVMSDPQWCRPIGKHRQGWARGPQREKGLPEHRRFLVSKPTNLDCRQAVIDYCRGGRQPNTVQTLVRGHWHTVLHGPRKSLRRLQWMQPYWRGDLEAPIKTPHLMVDFQV